MASYWTNFWTSAAGPAIACIFTNPLDVAKTRLNMERELQASHKTSGVFNVLQRTAQSEGVSGLQRGLKLAMVREASKNTFRIGLYQPIVDMFHDKGSGPAPLRVLLGASMTSGAVSAFITNPLDLLKTRLQLDGSHARGTAAGTPIAMGAAIVREEGLGGLWRGTSVSMVRSGFGAAALLPTNSRLKEFAASYMPAGAASDGFCALGAGAANVATINPVDVVRTRLYSQPLDAAGKGTLYDGALDAARKIMTIEGPAAFYKGATAHFLRVGPHTMLTFVFIGLIRRAVASS